MRVTPIERVFQYSLWGMLASGYLAVLGSGSLDILTAFVALIGLGLRAWAISGRPLEIPPAWITIATLVYVAFYPIDFFYVAQDFLGATLHLLFFLATVKVVTATTERDYFWLKLIAFAEILAASIVSVSASYVLWLTVFLLCSLVMFSTAEIRRSASRGRQISRQGLEFFPQRILSLTGGVSVAVVVLTVGLFFVLPRTTRAALQAWIDPRYHLSGFSNQVTLGQIGEIRLKHEPVMHVRIFDDTPDLPLKWRGAALNRFDGRTWTASSLERERLFTDRGIVPLASAQELARPGRRITYDVQLRPTGADTLFFAGLPEHLRIDVPSVQRSPAGSFFSMHITGRVVRYGVHSRLEGLLAPGGLSESELPQYLQLPKLDPRISILANDWADRAADGSPLQRALMLERMLRQSYKYSTELLDREVPDPLAHFLFDRGKGHCEYFASALAVMLREVGIPSRVVTGFQRGQFNPVSGWYVVRASDAHSWVEAFVPERGWITLDPTPPDLNALSPSTLTARLANYFDALEIFWQDWVLSYNLEQQAQLANRVDQSRRSINLAWLTSAFDRVTGSVQKVKIEDSRLPVILVVWIALTIAGWRLLPVLTRWWALRQQQLRVSAGRVRARDATILYQRMLAALQRRGYAKPPWVTPREFVGHLSQTPFRPTAAEITDAYYLVRFGQDHGAAARMLELIQELESAR